MTGTPAASGRLHIAVVFGGQGDGSIAAAGGGGGALTTIGVAARAGGGAGGSGGAAACGAGGGGGSGAAANGAGGGSSKAGGPVIPGANAMGPVAAAGAGAGTAAAGAGGGGAGGAAQAASHSGNITTSLAPNDIALPSIVAIAQPPGQCASQICHLVPQSKCIKNRHSRGHGEHRC